MRRLRVESLESRVMLHAEGLAWTGGPDLTISFAPDGTEVGGQASDLFAELGTQQTTAWQDAVLSAFRTWAQYTSTNVNVVTDNGAPFGVAGPTQGDPRFGDVRIAAVPLASDVIAISVPHNEFISGTWAGDVLINSNARFANVDELFSVMLHEAGHVFGLGHSNDPASPMFLHGVSPAVTPTAQDIADLRKAYGTPVQSEERDEERNEERNEEHNEESRYDQSRDDESHAEEERREDSAEDERMELSRAVLATDVQYVYANSDQALHYVSSGVIDSAQDVDAFRLSAGEVEADGFTFLTVTVRSTDPGGLIPQAAVFSSDGTKLKGQILVNADGTFVLQVADVSPKRDYVIRVRGADTAGPFQSGGYQLEAQYVDHPAQLKKFVAETLSSAKPQSEQSLHVNETTLAHFVLTVDPVKAAASVALWAVVYDAAGSVMGRFAAHAGESRSSGTLLLAPGDYRLELTAARPDGGWLPEVGFQLLGKTISLPIGPGILDPTRAPMLPRPNLGGGASRYFPPALAVTNPIVFPGPISMPTPPRPIIVSPPWTDPSWWYWRGAPLAGSFSRSQP